MTVEEWGGYLRVTSTARLHHAVKSIRVLLGEKPPLPFQQAVFVGGADYPLVVTGKNRIVGDVTVGPEGVKRGRIKGRDFDGENLVAGRIFRQAKSQMPYFNAALFQKALARYENALAHPAGQFIHGVTTFILSEAQRLSQDGRLHFSGDIQIAVDDSVKIQTPLLISAAGNMTLRGSGRLDGFVELIASGKITLVDHVQMKDCILFTKAGIEIAEACQVEGQLLSLGDIAIKDRATLNYPSLVYSHGALKENSWQGRIILQDQAVVRGAVILASPAPSEALHNDMLVQIGREAKVVGAVYSGSDTEHLGTIYGSVITRKFYLYESPTIYLNWLQDATTDRTKLPEEFLLPLLFSEQPRLEVLAWDELQKKE